MMYRYKVKYIFYVYILIANSAIEMYKLKLKGYNYIIGTYIQKFLKLNISLFLLETCNVS